MTLKDKIIVFYEEAQDEFDGGEIDQGLDILENYDEDLTGLTESDGSTLQRIIDEDELVQEIEQAITSEHMDPLDGYGEDMYE